MDALKVLKFQVGNAKLVSIENTETGETIVIRIYTFSLPSGYSCPAANECLAKADRVTGKITDGIDMEFRCFSATDEARSPNARNARWHNFELLKRESTATMVELIQRSLPKAAQIVRIHVAGDFFNQRYFDAWRIVASNNPEILFYAYTKSLDYWKARIDSIPANLNLTASVGGTHDSLIAELGLKYSKVVYHPDEADKLGLEIDHDDSHAMYGTKPFALLLHGTQPAKSIAAVAKQRMVTENIKFSYSRK
tara:strand:- start:2624 stop:3379 length:756 start_codon:yes stop_codon:yes gene_type:complete